MAFSFEQIYGKTPLAKYGKTPLMFPPDNVPKNKEWYTACVNAILYKYFNNDLAITAQRIYEIRENRAYGGGTQDNQKYKDTLMPKDETETSVQARKGYLNVNWTPISMLPKLKNILHSALKDEDFIPVCFCIDEQSTIDKNKEIVKLYLEKFTAPLEKEAAQKTGEDYSPPPYIPENISEIELIQQNGGIKLAREIAVEKALQAAFQESKWSEIVHKKLLSDLFENCIAATKTYTDIHTNRVKTRYVNIERFIAPYNSTYEYTNLPIAGEIVDWCIKDLKIVMPEVPELEWQKLAQMYSKRFGNRDLYRNTGVLYGDSYYYDNTTQTYIYDDFTVPVFEGEWQSTETKYYTEKTDSRNQNRFVEEDYEAAKEKLKSEKKRGTVKETVKKFYYQAKVVVGTDYVFDYGKVYNIGWASNKAMAEPTGSYAVYRTEGISIVEIHKPFVDMMCNTWFALQNAVATAGPDILTIETEAVKRAMNGAKVTAKDLLKMKQSGIAPWKRTSKNPMDKENGDFPFNKVPGGIGVLLNELISLFELYWSLMQRFSGMTDIATGVNPETEQGLGVSNIAVTATDNAIRPLFDACINIKKATAENINLKIQALAFTKEYISYYNIIGQGSSETIKLTKAEALFSYGIFIKIKPTKQQIAEIETAALQFGGIGKDGVAGLTFSEYTMLKRMLNEYGNLKMASEFLAYSLDKRTRQQQEAAQKITQIQSQEIQNQIITKTNEEMRLNDHQTNNLIKLEIVKSIFDAQKQTTEQETAVMQNLLDKMLAGENMVGGVPQKVA